ncbi:hypothetical protein, partial [Actinophytocola sp.]|uniref:hypothetical protein n=1 Tax=Actinophytocola sp. TaxID=1872138 RepID=UPI00389AB7E6
MRRCYHLPADITVPDGLPAVAGQRLAAVLADAVGRAVRAAAPGETAVPQPNPRAESKEWVGPTWGAYDIPSYDDGGRKVHLPVVGEDVLTSSVGAPFTDSLTADGLRAQVTLLVRTLERGVADAAARTAMTQNLEFLEAYAAAHGITLPAATAYEFRQVLKSHVADLRRHLEALQQIRTDVPPATELGMTLNRDRLVEWHLDQLAWIEEATRHAGTLVSEAEGGGTGSAQKFADAGTELTTAIFGLRTLAIILAYEGLNYEVATRYPVTDLTQQGVRLVHRSLDTVLQGLRNRLPG